MRGYIGGVVGGIKKHPPASFHTNGGIQFTSIKEDLVSVVTISNCNIPSFAESAF